jgi:integrase
MKITKPVVSQLTLPVGKTEAIFFDDEVPGFGLRLRAGGSRTFVVQYGLGGRQRRMTIGSAKLLDPAKARATAKDLLAKVRLGQDPAAERAAARLRASDEALGVIAERFLARQERRVRPRTYTEIKRYLERHWKPLRSIPVTTIDRSLVSARLGKLASEHGPIAADRARAALSSFFAWAIGEGLCDVNPVIGTNKHFDGATARDRVLSDRELATIWKVLPDSDYGGIVRLLILTGQRREEIAGLRWSEIDMQAAVITLPSERTKNRRAHEIPVSKPALSILNSRPVYVNRDFVFGDGPRRANAEGKGGFQGWSKAKVALDERAKLASPWRLHDVRRTVATRMADLGIAPYIVEAVLNHISGHKAGVAGIYNRSSYAAEKKAALERWANHVQALVEHALPPEVLKFPRAAKPRPRRRAA